MDWIVVFGAGLLVGEFLGKCAYRIPRRIGLFRSGSFCPHCHMYLAPYFKLPLLSYLLLRGRCFYCHGPISLRYPTMEMGTALGALALFWRFGLTPQFLFYSVFFCFLMTISFIDAETQLIPNRLIVLMLLSAAVVNLFVHVRPWGQVFLGSVMGGASMVFVLAFSRLVHGRSLIGLGDLQLAAAAGAFLGPTGVLIAVISGFLFAAGVTLLSGLWRSNRFREGVPFVPFLAAGIMILLLWGVGSAGLPVVADLFASVP